MAYRNIDQMVECFRQNQQDLLVESFNEEIRPMIRKDLKAKFIINTVWDIVSKKIKTGK